MVKLYLGKIVNTHGIKGEIRIVSSFEKKELVFKKGFFLYIGKDEKKEEIKTYRVHKNYDMVTLSGINNINDVLKYKGCNVYINKEDLHLKENEYLLSDLIGFKIKGEDIEYGEVVDIFDETKNILLKVNFTKDYYIPYNSNYIKQVDIKNKKIIVENVRELIL